MKSMTGFGRAERQVGPAVVIAEGRSFNNRFLDIAVSAPQLPTSAEQTLRSLVAEQVSRGRVELHIRLRGSFNRRQISAKGAEEGAELLRSLARAAGLSEDITVQDLLAADRRLELEVVEEDVINIDDNLWAAVIEAARYCLQLLCAEREREGAELAVDVSGCLDQVDQATGVLESVATEWQNSLERDTKLRVNKLLDQDEAGDRVVPALALLLARSDVHEELKRLRAHLAGVRATIVAAGPHGKKMEFYCQELLREANTVVSKAASVEIDSQVIVIKENLERMREQLRNVE